ncbi:hypothetical protein KMW28_26560 [Flammeovirga yaeyamensis]|uniref:GH26 domain-containing protein n=1 Tax=Flammeovirga yaeyamensis TaxID=367791 RepID=A0AAX1NBY0_9BACT|nr:glycosyl hydrolase [Flammeovirga yaeyamensis]MBB3701357.1 hypothetical protein [Flammeovirga yaeyamensis]QWG04461.1 hypothetical protein KMW28_26560 [Flammeovirga yaeyamensis]
MNFLRRLCISACAVFLISACTSVQKKQTKIEETSRAKFEPEDGKCLVFIGQELTSIGGLEEYNNGYLDYFERRPAGFTAYTVLTPGEESFGFTHKGLDGVTSTADWGDNDSNMSLQLGDEDYKNMALAIGLGMVHHDSAVAYGERDEMIRELGNFLQQQAPRPIFLRIGYEFDGHDWNHYNREHYIKAYKRIKDIYDEMGITNVAYVWQSCGFMSSLEELEQWYPGDDYVDWCAFSFFGAWKKQNMIAFAKQKGKPVFIAEATPALEENKETDLANQDQAVEAWENWFTPFFATIHQNPKTVKAISYINCNWKAHRMWFDNPTFKYIDSRLQVNPMIMEKWEAELEKETYLMSSDNLYDKLNGPSL